MDKKMLQKLNSRLNAAEAFFIQGMKEVTSIRDILGHVDAPAPKRGGTIPFDKIKTRRFKNILEKQHEHRA